MNQDVEYQILCEIEDEKPYAQLGFRFRDYFETNDYCIVSETYKFGSHENIPFNVFKDDEKIGRVCLQEGNVPKMVDDFLSILEDHDFKKIFISEHRKSVETDLTNFFKHFRKSILENKFTLEGEIKRMKAVAGII